MKNDTNINLTHDQINQTFIYSFFVGVIGGAVGLGGGVILTPMWL